MVTIKLPRTDKLEIPQIELSETYKVRCTTNYSQFKLMEENRPIEHMKAILACILLVGYLPIPAIVNEFMQICDGQGRLEVCKKYNLPFYYMVVPGVRIEHVRKINFYMTKWKLKNFVDSYSKDNLSYNYFKNLRIQFPDIVPRVIYAAATGIIETGGNINKTIENGKLKLDERNYDDAVNVLEWLTRNFSFIWKSDNVRGQISDLQLALIFAHECDKVSNSRLEEKFITFASNDIKKMNQLERYLARVGSIDNCLELISSVYNRGLGERTVYDRVDLRHEYHYSKKKVKK